MAFNATKLTADLREANKIACEYVKDMHDGGTANLDSVFLRIPRIREEKVLDAIRNAGLYCSHKTEWSWFGNGYMITPTCAGQGNKRSVGVEFMKKSLEEQGWNVITFCRND